MTTDKKSKSHQIKNEVKKLEEEVSRGLKKEIRRWPALLAFLAIGGIYMVLSERLVFGPGWLLLPVILALVIPALILRRQGKHRLNHYILLMLCFLITLAEVISISLLLLSLPDKTIPATTLLGNAGLLWGTNILVFALWYWQLEAGGPNERVREPADIYHQRSELFFPQLTMLQMRPEMAHWRPGFIDYLFVAFNTSTAFSPTDTPVLSSRIKVLSMVQSVLSLVTVATLAARAVNMF